MILFAQRLAEETGGILLQGWVPEGTKCAPGAPIVAIVSIVEVTTEFSDFTRPQSMLLYLLCSKSFKFLQLPLTIKSHLSYCNYCLAFSALISRLL